MNKQEIYRHLTNPAIHPNDNTATLCLNTEDLLRVLTAGGAVVHMVQI